MFLTSPACGGMKIHPALLGQSELEITVAKLGNFVYDIFYIRIASRAAGRASRIRDQSLGDISAAV
jgi:hypothetical protein